MIDQRKGNFFLSTMRCNFEKKSKSANKYDNNSFFHFYFSNVHMSVNNEFGNPRLDIHVM